MALAALPRIIRFIGTNDSGEYGNASCPHCGADGRYVVRFKLEDGRQAGAMRGCLKLFPVAPIANEELRLQDKAARYAKNGWKLNRGDSAAVDMIERFYSGEVPESVALAACKAARNANAARFRGRR